MSIDPLTAELVDNMLWNTEYTQNAPYLITCSKDPTLTDWNMFLYWNRPSFAICDLRRSTQSSRYLNMIGSRTDSDQLYAHFLFRNTSCRVSRALAGFSRSINSVDGKKKQVPSLFGYVKVFLYPKGNIMIYIELRDFVCRWKWFQSPACRVGTMIMKESWLRRHMQRGILQRNLYSPLALLRAFSGLWPYRAMLLSH